MITQNDLRQLQADEAYLAQARQRQSRLLRSLLRGDPIEMGNLEPVIAYIEAPETGETPGEDWGGFNRRHIPRLTARLIVQHRVIDVDWEAID